MQHEVAPESRMVARDLESEGLNGTDIAFLMKVSPQRASQLLASPPAVTAEVTPLKNTGASRPSFVSSNSEGPAR